MPATDPLPAPDSVGPLGPGEGLPGGLDTTPPSFAILRVLRVALHVGFAALLGVAVLRLLVTDGADPLRYVWAGAAFVLAGVYLTGTILEKRSAAGGTGFDPRRYGVLWLGIITALWFLLLAGSADFAWLAFPLFFLHLHLLPRRIALLTIALMTAAVIAAQWTASGLPVPQPAVVIGPLFGAAFAVVTGLAYLALYREAENQRRAADELRRTRAELDASQHDAGVLAERERLAREIHDTLAQGFSSIVLVARAAEKSLADGDTATAAARFALVQQTASENLAEARSFVRGLSSPQLQGASLIESLRRLCESTETSAAARGLGLRCRFELDGDPVELPQPYRVTLLRAAQASLANVRDHAGAGNAVVTIAFLGSEVTMDIYDDGVGFDPSGLTARTEARTDGSGYGIRSLQQRVSVLNGSLDLESAPGEGTVVAVRLPLDETPWREE
ncbi:Sensor histidine kinase LiaS [Arthrobacter ulcerisalmonis]|uniref:Oxygen sensor histidine kinase NreB n=1 Tax=Arthrobacter ulcerisalmonis TaxID=2483813 RepID=A0A3P5WJR2_9MICC|nr:sensor histidine kinase [Arthrobacter ulcerisalmonis]VDC23883.1 Sensor histidine kinase LiaS [Arthrobacter ulcerisalmonis]